MQSAAKRRKRRVCRLIIGRGKDFTPTTNQWGISGYANTTVEMKPHLSTDLNQDGAVNIQDITIVAAAYGSRTGDSKWNAVADLDKNGVVNIIDMTMVAKDYGKTL